MLNTKSLLLLFAISMVSFVFADDDLPWEEENVYKQETGFIFSVRGGWVLERELGYLEDDIQIDVGGGVNNDAEIEANYDAGGAVFDLGVRYQNWSETWLWSVNGMVSVNPYYKNDADFEIRDLDANDSIKIEDDAEAFHISTEFSAMVGLGTPDSFHFEMGPGIYYRYTDVEFENVDIELLKTHFLGFTFDFVFRTPLDKENRWWLKLFARIFPYTIVDSETNILGATFTDIDGTENFKSFKLEASLSYVLFKSDSFFTQIEFGWNYNRLVLTGINDDTVIEINGSGDNNAIDEFTFIEHGPFVALNVGL